LLNVDYNIFLILLPPVCQRFLVLLFIRIKPVPYLGVLFFSNVTLLPRDTFDYIKRTNETTILVSLDQEKAFDRVNRSFLIDLLVAVGFGPDFRRWIATLYNGACMRIILNNWLTERISLEGSVRQGAPLSPLLYVLCIEVFYCIFVNVFYLSKNNGYPKVAAPFAGKIRK